jgi:NADPH-dependent glutamate synthase beta subunit-like oxidoreductase/ferredoxin
MSILTRGAYAKPATSLQFKTGTWRVQKPMHRHRPAPCHAVCPAGEDAQAYLAKVAEGKLQEAWATLVQANPLPATTGRVCHHPCEGACNRGQYDEAIAIHNVERYLGDEALRRGWEYPVRRPHPTAAAMAVVGAGPAGLSAAYHLVRLGYNVTLFDSLPEAGGTLRTAIPQYRLPRDILNREIERLLSVGIYFRPQQTLGRHIHLDELRSHFRAVFVATGNQKAREWSVDGSTPSDLHVGLDLLKEWIAIGSAPEARSVAIVGAGNTAVDLARVLRRSGVEQVHIISHKSIPGPGLPPGDVMPAIPREVEQALEEGVTIHEHRGIHRLILRGGKVIGVEMVHMKKLRQPDGKLRRVEFEGTETVLHVDQVIPAIGQVVDPLGIEALLDHRDFFRVDEWGRFAKHPGVYTGGDARGDRGTVSEAVGDGRRAAIAMDAQVHGLELPMGERREALGFDKLNLNYFEHAPRARESVLPVEQRRQYEEIEGGLNANQVRSESERCFSCGNCFACDNCWTLCPDEAVLKTRDVAEDGTHYLFDYDYCKGCGLCAKECPCGFITMLDEL